MSSQGMSYQQLDPVGSYGSRPITLVFAAIIMVIAGGGILLTWPTISDQVVAYLAILACAISMLGIVHWSSPLRAPFSRTGMVVVMSAAALSIVFGALATWTQPTNLVNQWASITVGLTLVVFSSYRSARELVAATILGGILVGFVTVLHPVTDRNTLPVLVVVLDAQLPLVALGAGATAYSAVMVRTLGRWYSRVADDGRQVSPAIKDSLVRSVHDDRVGILNHTVVPFLTDLLERDEITADDRDRARVIAATIRAAMVADVDRIWLDPVIDQLAIEHGDSTTSGSEVVQDHHRLSNRMSIEQRVVMRAFIVALFVHPGFDSDGFAIHFARHGSNADVTLTAKLDADDSPNRTGLGAYFAVLRIAFGDLQLTFQAPTLTLKFSYDHK